MAKLILSEYSPRMIVLHLGRDDFRGEREALDRLSPLLPHADNPDVSRLLALRSPYERYKLLSRTYAYNSMVVPLLGAALIPKYGVHENGYAPLYGSELTKALQAPLSEKAGRAGEERRGKHGPVEGIFLRALEDVIVSARARDIVPVVSVSPAWGTSALDDAVLELIEDRGAEYIEITRKTHPMFRDPRLFKTRGYLNADGAEMFSRLFAGELRHRSLCPARPGSAAPSHHGRKMTIR